MDIAAMKAQLEILIQAGIKWVREQRDKHRITGRYLTDKERQMLSPYFYKNTLDRVVINYVPVLEDPDFYYGMRQRGEQIPIEFRDMLGIIFIDTVVIAESKLNQNPAKLIPILSHECVHVCQYKYLEADARQLQ